MTLYENHLSSGDVSFAALRGLTGQISGHSPLGYLELAREAVHGGWPSLLGAADRHATPFSSSYLEDVCASNLPFAEGVRRDPTRIRRILGSLARNTASEVTLRIIAADVSADGGTITVETVCNYLDLLSQIFVL